MTVLLSETKLLLLKLSIREDRVLFERRFIKHLVDLYNSKFLVILFSQFAHWCVAEIFCALKDHLGMI